MPIYIFSTGRYGKPQRKHDVIVTPMIHEWAMKACHRCLVCLGDIGNVSLHCLHFVPEVFDQA